MTALQAVYGYGLRASEGRQGGRGGGGVGRNPFPRGIG